MQYWGYSLIVGNYVVMRPSLTGGKSTQVEQIVTKGNQTVIGQIFTVVNFKVMKLNVSKVTLYYWDKYHLRQIYSTTKYQYQG